jgi:hypothetical protein
MPDLFARPKGAVALIRGAGQGMISSIDVTAGGTSLLNDDVNILITSLALSQSVKMAYFPTIGDSLYIYPLGNDISKCQLAGMALPVSVCEDSAGGGYTAAEKILKLYEDNRASSFDRLSEPVKLVLPPVTLEGFIDGMTAQISSDPATFGFVKFTLTMSIIPPVRDP